MGMYHVELAVARGARWDTGQRIEVDVLAPSRLDAAIQAESLADRRLSTTEYSHTRNVQLVRETGPAALALAA